jgi:hypothetical protein
MDEVVPIAGLEHENGGCVGLTPEPAPCRGRRPLRADLEGREHPLAVAHVVAGGHGQLVIALA